MGHIPLVRKDCTRICFKFTVRALQSLEDIKAACCVLKNVDQAAACIHSPSLPHFPAQAELTLAVDLCLVFDLDPRPASTSLSSLWAFQLAIPLSRGFHRHAAAACLVRQLLKIPP